MAKHSKVLIALPVFIILFHHLHFPLMDSRDFFTANGLPPFSKGGICLCKNGIPTFLSPTLQTRYH